MYFSPGRRVVLFLILVFAFSAVTFAFKLGPFATMWGPAVAALVTSLLTRRKLREIGWKPWPVKWLAAGWAIPVVVSFAAYGTVWLTGLGAVPNPTFLERARITLGMPAAQNWLLILAAFGYITILALLPNMLVALGEEIGWRGFLVPELAKFMTFRQTAIISGVIWCVWHLPMILSGSYGAAGTPRWYQIACFSAMVILSAIVSAWLRLKSGSIWPVTIMHATHNGAIQTFFDRITQDTGHTHYFTGEFGFMLLPFFAAMAWYCLAKPPKEAKATDSMPSFAYLSSNSIA
jgi:membrane protease YdiL (CAAX protease family)